MKMARWSAGLFLVVACLLQSATSWAEPTPEDYFNFIQMDLRYIRSYRFKKLPPYIAEKLDWRGGGPFDYIRSGLRAVNRS